MKSHEPTPTGPAIVDGDTFRSLVAESLYHLRLDRAAEAYHHRAEAALSASGLEAAHDGERREKLARLVATGMWGKDLSDHYFNPRYDGMPDIRRGQAYHTADLILAAGLAAPSSRLRLIEALNDAVATLAAVRATASSDDWAEAADHFYELCGAEIVKLNAALRTDRDGEKSDAE